MPKCLSGCFPMERIKPGRWRPWKSLILNFGGKESRSQKRTLLRPVHQGKREKEDSGSPMAGTGIFGRHVAFFTRYQTYKMSNKGLVGIVNPKLNVTEPSAYFWKSDEKSPVFLGQYLFFQNSNKKMIALVERYFEDDPAMLEQIRQRRWLGKGGGVAALFAFVAEHYVPQQEQE